MPSPQPSYEPIGLLNCLDTLILNIDNTGHGPALLTIEINTPIRHQLLYKPTTRRHVLGCYFTNMALLQISPFIPVKLLKYDKYYAIIVI